MRIAILFCSLLLIASCTPAEPVSPEPTRPEEGTMVSLYFDNTEFNPNTENCAAVFPVERFIPATDDIPSAALAELFDGPTEEEHIKGYRSVLTSDIENSLIYVTVVDHTAIVNLYDLRDSAPSLNSSCMSAQFFASVEATLTQFSAITNVFYQIEGDAETFYEWMQIGCTENNNFCTPPGTL